MDFIFTIKLTTWILCIVNYALLLYNSNWDFGDIRNVGWLMAVLGWGNALI
jgi:hypothetical protein